MKKVKLGATPQTVDDYLAALPEEARATLEKIRKTIKAVAPKATEVISYQIPMYKHHGMLVGFAAFKNHCSFFPGAKPLATYKDELKGYKTSKGTIHFSWLPALFLLMDGIMKLVKPAPVVEATVWLGYSENVIIPLGIVLLVSTVLYLIPRTNVLGAILLTGYLGGQSRHTSASVKVCFQCSSRSVSACCSGWGCTYAMTGCAHSFLCEVRLLKT